MYESSNSIAEKRVEISPAQVLLLQIKNGFNHLELDIRKWPAKELKEGQYFKFSRGICMKKEQWLKALPLIQEMLNEM